MYVLVSSYLNKFYLYDKIDKDEHQLQAQYTCTFTLMCYIDISLINN